MECLPQAGKGWIKFRYTNVGKKVVGRRWTVVKMSTEAKITVCKSVLLPKGERELCLEKPKNKLNAVRIICVRSVCGKTRKDKLRKLWELNECGLNIQVSDP